MADPWAEFEVVRKPEDDPWAEFEVVRQPAPAAAPKQAENRAVGIIRAAGQGVTFGFADELKAAAMATKRRISGDAADWYTAFTEELEKDRGRIQAFEETNPYLSAAGNVAGSLVLPGGVAGAAKSVGQAALRGGAVGTATGAATGFGSAEGGFTNRAIGAAGGGLVGAGLGAGAGAAVKSLGGLPGLLPGRAAKAQGQAILRNALEAEGLPPGEIARRIAEANKAGVTGVTIGDVATEGPVQTLAESVIHHPSRMQGPYTGMLKKRQAGQMTIKGNVGGQLEATELDVRKAAGLAKQRAFATAQDLAANRKEQAARLFGRAHRFDPSADPNLISAWHDLLETETGEHALRSARRLWKDARPKQPFPLDDPRSKPTMEVMQLFKEGMDDAVQAAFKEGGSVGKQAALLRDQFKKTLVQANPAYGEALKQYAGDKALEEALEKGRNFLKTPADEVEDTIAKLTPGEVEQFQIGAVTALFDKRKVGPTVDYTGPILKDQDNFRRVMAIMPDDEARELLFKQLTARQGMAGLSARAANSATSRREAVDELIKGGKGAGDIPTTWLGLGKLVLDRTVGKGAAFATQQRRGEIGRLLMEQDSAALQALQRLPKGPSRPEMAPARLGAPLGAAAGRVAGSLFEQPPAVPPAGPSPLPPAPLGSEEDQRRWQQLNAGQGGALRIR